MAKHDKVTYDSDDRGGVFIVHTPNKKLSLFSTQEGSLSGSKQQGKCRGHDAMTLQEKFEDFTKIQIEAATKATCLQALIGHSSQH